MMLTLLLMLSTTGTFAAETPVTLANVGEKFAAAKKIVDTDETTMAQGSIDRCLKNAAQEKAGLKAGLAKLGRQAGLSIQEARLFERQLSHGDALVSQEDLEGVDIDHGAQQAVNQAKDAAEQKIRKPLEWAQARERAMNKAVEDLHRAFTQVSGARYLNISQRRCRHFASEMDAKLNPKHENGVKAVLKVQQGLIRHLQDRQRQLAN